MKLYLLDLIWLTFIAIAITFILYFYLKSNIKKKNQKHNYFKSIYKNKNKINCKLSSKPVIPINWTSDKIIPLKKYNKHDCTNDTSCIIQPDNLNLFPKNDKKYSKCQEDCIQNNSCVIKPDNLNLYPTHEYNKNVNQITFKTCMLCSKEINMVDNPVTEHFSSINPYRPESLYKSPKDVLQDDKIDKIINKITNNIQQKKPNINIPLDHLKKLSKNMCRHCKIGLCVNDGCYSL